MIKILDCTLRDGGYYTNWDFTRKTVDEYIEALNKLPIDYIEVGYRSREQAEYYGKYFYMPLYELQHLKKLSTKKLVIILNEKDVNIEDLEDLLSPIQDLVDMIRIAIDPNNISRAIELAKKIKEYGFKVGFNVMYMSTWMDNTKFIESLASVDGFIDCFYMVDSFGGVYPNDVIEIIKLLKSKISCPLGFHGHNNLELALVNTLTAIENGVEYIDSTILGMGRGAGNLKTELLLTVLNQKFNVDVDFNALEKAVSSIQPLLDKYYWGTNLPYMISGSSSLPQKEVMEWVSNRAYSLNSIVRALDNKRNKLDDNEEFTKEEFEIKANKVLIVGGGLSVSDNIDGITALLEKNSSIVIVHASSKNAFLFKEFPHKQYFCLVGNEGYRLEKTLNDLSIFNGNCILPPFPRKMGTYVPKSIKSKTRELKEINFTDLYKDAHTALALQITINLSPSEVLITGYDGYDTDVLSKKELDLYNENEYLFNKVSISNIILNSLTKTKYNIPSAVNIFYQLSK